MSTPLLFNESIPQKYEDYLTPFLFDPYAEDLVDRIEVIGLDNVLEVACGTGAVTKKLLAHLPSTAQLVATDLQPDMLDIAKRSISFPNVTWDVVDMTNIPYEDNRFDLIICQFGLMLVPEKLKALAEMRRVLRPGGHLLLNVWGSSRYNQIWNIAGTVIQSFLGGNPMLLDPGPFSLADENTGLDLLKKAGFQDAKVTAVDKTGKIENAAMAAKGFIEGLPLFTAIRQKDPALPARIQEALEVELVNQLGDYPLQSSMQALVFETIK